MANRINLFFQWSKGVGSVSRCGPAKRGFAAALSFPSKNNIWLCNKRIYKTVRLVRTSPAGGACGNAIAGRRLADAGSRTPGGRAPGWASPRVPATHKAPRLAAHAQRRRTSQEEENGINNSEEPERERASGGRI